MYEWAYVCGEYDGVYVCGEYTYAYTNGHTCVVSLFASGLWWLSRRRFLQGVRRGPCVVRVPLACVCILALCGCCGVVCRVAVCSVSLVSPSHFWWVCRRGRCMRDVGSFVRVFGVVMHCCFVLSFRGVI